MKLSTKNFRNVTVKVVCTLILVAGVLATSTGCDEESMRVFGQAFAEGFEFGYNGGLDGLWGDETDNGLIGTSTGSQSGSSTTCLPGSSTNGQSTSDCWIDDYAWYSDGIQDG